VGSTPSCSSYKRRDIVRELGQDDPCSLDFDMNRKQLSRNIGQMIRLRPLPWRIDWNRRRLDDVDDMWMLDGVDDHPARVRLHHIATGHIIELASDNVEEWRSPDFLLLRCQIIIGPLGVDIEPIRRGSPLFPTPANNQSPQTIWDPVDVEALKSLRTALKSVEDRQAQLERSHPCPKCGTITDHAICPNCRFILR
jgi:hypothetical protein